MFEKYNIGELYLGSIDVMYADNYGFDTNVGGMLMAGTAGYGYWTILRKIGEDQFVDLQDPKRSISRVRDPKRISYTVDYMEPLSNYYTKDGKVKEVFSRRQAIKEASNHYNSIHQKRLEMIRERNCKSTN